MGGHLVDVVLHRSKALRRRVTVCVHLVGHCSTSVFSWLSSASRAARSKKKKD
jgi:hypothetical protein